MANIKRTIKETKMKKAILILFLLTINWALLGQTYPVNNLFYEQTYSYGNHNCPAYNCFVLSWDSPDSSNDTLKGYAIYRDSEFWIFTENTEIECSGYAPCAYSDFFDPAPFWITVKAVYNSDSSLSIANDSAFVEGIMINVDEIEEEEVAILNNPIVSGEDISLLFPITEGEPCRIKVYSLNGELVKRYETKELTNRVVSISTTKMPQGLYVINILLGEKTINKKVMIE